MTRRELAGPSSLARSLGGAVLRHVRLVRGARRLCAASAATTDHGELFDAVFATEAFRPLQRRAEFVGLMRRIVATRPRTVCEIGTAAGGTAFLWTRVAAEDAVVILVDHAMDASRRAAFRRFARAGQRVACIEGESCAPRTLAAVERALAGRLIDVLFIDGDHRYESVAADLRSYAPLVHRGGLIVFHDILPDHGRTLGVETCNDSGEVFVLWQELRVLHPERTEEFVDDPAQNGCGIGVLTWPGGSR